MSQQPGSQPRPQTPFEREAPSSQPWQHGAANVRHGQRGHAGGGRQSMTPEDFEQLCHNIESTVANLSRVVGQGIGVAGGAIGRALENLQQEWPASPESPKQPPEAATVERVETIGRPEAQRPGAAAPGTSAATPGQHPWRQTRDNAGSPFPPSANPLAKQRGLVAKRIKSGFALKLSGVAMAIGGGLGALTFISCGAFSLIAGMLGPDALAQVGTAELGIAAGAYGTAAGVLFLAAGGLSLWLCISGAIRIDTASRAATLKRLMGTREVCTIDELAAQAHRSPRQVLKTLRRMLKYGLLPEGRLDDDQTCLMVTDNAYRLYRQSQQHYQQKLQEQQAQEQARALARSQGKAAELTEADHAFLQQGRNYVEQLKQLDIAIDDGAVSEKIVSIQEVVNRILGRAEEEPGVIGGLDRLTDYYLPTTVKLLSAYDSLEEQPVQGENIRASRAEIEQTLDTLHGAYEKLLDSTYQDLSMNVSADISVLNAVLAQEGLTDGPFNKKKP